MCAPQRSAPLCQFYTSSFNFVSISNSSFASLGYELSPKNLILNTLFFAPRGNKISNSKNEFIEACECKPPAKRPIMPVFCNYFQFCFNQLLKQARLATLKESSEASFPRRTKPCAPSEATHDASFLQQLSILFQSFAQTGAPRG